MASRTWIFPRLRPSPPLAAARISRVRARPSRQKPSGTSFSRTKAPPAEASARFSPVLISRRMPACRRVPDVAGDADPVTGYNVYVDGQPSVIGGTSAVAPLWAGLIARINSALGNRVGYILPQLYATAKNSGEFRDVISGNNGAYSAKPGWDACTGWGSPRGAAILSALS